MQLELRTYWAVPGRMPALVERFRDVTLPLFARHGMSVVAFWNPQEEPDTLVYLLVHENAPVAAWEAFRDDPDWIEGKAASERSAGGPLTTRVTSEFVDPVEGLPLPQTVTA